MQHFVLTLLAFWHWFQTRAIGSMDQSETPRWQTFDRSAQSVSESALLPGRMAHRLRWFWPCSFRDCRAVTNRTRSRSFSLRLFRWLDVLSRCGIGLAAEPAVCRVSFSQPRIDPDGLPPDRVPPGTSWPRR
jgi:hypothetical protein